jgi:hypothetical protein
VGILLDPNKRFIAIEIYYIEEIKKHGNSVFKFVRSRDELEEWKKKGYAVEGEPPQAQQPQQSQQPQQATNSKIIHKLVTHWTKPSWKDQNYIISRSLKTTTTSDGRTINELDGVKYRDLKLKMCLKKWSLTDETSGEPVAVTSEVIDMLDPVVAQELLTNFERVTEPTADDLKD